MSAQFLSMIFPLLLLAFSRQQLCEACSSLTVTLNSIDTTMPAPSPMVSEVMVVHNESTPAVLGYVQCSVCVPSAHLPEEIPFWFFNGSPLNHQSMGLTITGLEVQGANRADFTSSIIWSAVTTKQQAGNYSCSVGGITRSFQVVVNDQPSAQTEETDDADSNQPTLPEAFARCAEGIPSNSTDSGSHERPHIVYHTTELRLQDLARSNLKCTAVGDSPMMVLWMKEDVEIASACGHELSVPLLAVASSVGNYTCVTINRFGTNAAFVQVQDDQPMVLPNSADSSKSQKAPTLFVIAAMIGVADVFLIILLVRRRVKAARAQNEAMTSIFLRDLQAKQSNGYELERSKSTPLEEEQNHAPVAHSDSSHQLLIQTVSSVSERSTKGKDEKGGCRLSGVRVRPDDMINKNYNNSMTPLVPEPVTVPTAEQPKDLLKSVQRTYSQDEQSKYPGDTTFSNYNTLVQQLSQKMSSKANAARLSFKKAPKAPPTPDPVKSAASVSSFLGQEDGLKSAGSTTSFLAKPAKPEPMKLPASTTVLTNPEPFMETQSTQPTGAAAPISFFGKTEPVKSAAPASSSKKGQAVQSPYDLYTSAVEAEAFLAQLPPSCPLALAHLPPPSPLIPLDAPKSSILTSPTPPPAPTSPTASKPVAKPTKSVTLLL